MILFLDFDGVLNIPSHYGKSMFVPEYLARLEKIAIDHDLKIVISSSWRENFSLEEIRDFFSDNSLCERIIGCTPVVRQNSWPPYIREIRQLEIQKWMTDNNYDGLWIAIDDDKRIFEDGCINLVETEFRYGFNEEAGIELVNKILEFKISAIKH